MCFVSAWPGFSDGKQQWFGKTVVNFHEFFLRPKGGLLIAYISIAY